MQLKQPIKLVVGSVVVYVVMAACASVDTPMMFAGSQLDAADGTNTGGSDGAGGRLANDGASILDALTNPVGSAQASPYQSGSRLKAKYLAGSDGSKEFMGWHDSQLNIDCGFFPASDGTQRCMPTAPTYIQFFADSNCTQPIATVIKGNCATPPAYAEYSDTTAACSPSYHVYPVGPTYTPGTNIYLKGPAACASVPSSSYSSSYNFYSVGAEIQPSAYVQATTQTEP